MENYPVSLSIEYSEKSNRLTVLFRFILAIPIMIIIGLLTYSSYESGQASEDVERVYSVGVLFFPVLLMIVFRRKYPRWWFDWNLALSKFSMRVSAYLLFLRDDYPSTDEEQAVTLKIDYPDVENDLNQWLPLVKWFLAIPHYICLAFIFIGVVLITILAWFIVIITGNYPKGMFNFVVGFLRWCLRVEAYAVFLTTDKYPPFRISE